MPPRTPKLAAAGKALADALERVHERDRLQGRIDAELAALHVHMRTAAQLRGSPQGDETRALAHADQEEAKALRVRIDAMGDVDFALWKAYDDKEMALAEASPRAKDALRRVAAAIGAANARIGAVNDVAEIADRARKAMETVRGLIETARSPGNSRYGSSSSSLSTALAFARTADACMTRLSRALSTVPEWTRAPPATYSQFQGYGWTPMTRCTNELSAWLDGFFDAVKSRRRALQDEVRRLEAGRSRWVLRA